MDTGEGTGRGTLGHGHWERGTRTWTLEKDTRAWTLEKGH